MSENKPAPRDEARSLISRRRLLQAVPALAAFAAVGSATPVPALAAQPDGSLPTLAPAATVLAGNTLDMPLRPVADACTACSNRRAALGSRSDPNPSPLERILSATPLAESRLGLANWPLLDETEDINIGHFTFPISPFNVTADDGTQEFLLLSNNQVIANFRRSDYLEQIQKQLFDRAVWAMREGRTGTAIVEFDRPVTTQKVDRIVGLLGNYGVRSIIWGNELNDPSTPWRDDLPALFDVFSAANAARRKYGLNNLDLSLPGLAYYGHGEYLQKMFRAFRDLQRKKFPSAPNDLPVQRVADHFYGPVDTFLQRIKDIRGLMAAEGVTQLKYDLTELGNPSLGTNLTRASDQQMAEGFIHQVASIAIGSNLVDRINYYSLLDAADDHSVMRVEDGRLVKKPTYQAIVVAAKLLARLKTLNVLEERDLVRVDGRRTDGVSFQILWSKVSDRDLWTSLPAGTRVFDALGQEIKEERVGQFALRPRQHPALGGPARITVSQA